MDIRLIKNKKNNKAIIRHTWGNAAEIEDIINICKNQNIKIIEDASESLRHFIRLESIKINILEQLEMWAVFPLMQTKLLLLVEEE